MEATHSSQHHVTEVTPVPHKKWLPLPSMGTGLDWCLQRPTFGRVRQPVALIIPTSLLPAPPTVLIFLNFGFYQYYFLCSWGDIKATAGQSRAFLTLAPSFISTLHRGVSDNEKISQYRQAENHSTSHPSCSAQRPFH